jgi:hypothetical protein
MAAAIRVENNGRWIEAVEIEPEKWRLTLGLIDSAAEFLYVSSDVSFLQDTCESWLIIPFAPFLLYASTRVLSE